MKSTINIDPDLRMCYRVDDFTDPWRSAETVLCVHGFGESGEAWRAWVPHLARHFRVVRIDQRGFGESTPMPVDFAWSLDVLVRDLELAITKLGTGPVHLVGAKVAGPVVMRFAATRPHLARSVTVAGSLLKGPQQTGEWVDHITQHGVASWAQLTMSPRLGASMPQEAVNWWIELTSKTPQSTMLGLLRAVPQIDVSGDLQNIRCPTLVIATDSRRRPLQETAAWQKLIPDSELVALAGDAYHVAASQPDECARACVEFLLRRGRP